MALALALTFIIVLSCQPASASSVKRNITNGQHKLRREDYNSLSRNRPEVWPLTAVVNTKIDKSEIKQQSALQRYNSLDDICWTCLGIEDCRSKMRKFCSSPSANCPLFPQDFERNCIHYRCTSDFNCQVNWKNSVCSGNKCYCQWNSFYNFDDNKCDSIIYQPEQTTSRTTRTYVAKRGVFGDQCDTEYDCSGWANLLCVSSKCVCPNNAQPDYSSNFCRKDYVTNNSFKNPNYILGVAASSLLLLFSVAVCISECRRRMTDRSSNGDSRPVGTSALTGTSSTLDLTGGLADLPPEYSDVYMIALQGRAGELSNKLPTYDEAVGQSEWNSQPLFVITAHSSGEERNSALTLRTIDAQPQNLVESSESNGHINHGYDTFTL